MHAHEGEFTAASGDELTQRTYPLFFDVLRALLEGGVTVVAEAAFQNRLWRQGLDPLARLAEFRVVQCVSDVSDERVLARAPREAHASGLEVPSFDRLALEPAIEVDTTDGYRPDIAAIVAFVG